MAYKTVIRKYFFSFTGNLFEKNRVMETAYLKKYWKSRKQRWPED